MTLVNVGYIGKVGLNPNGGGAVVVLMDTYVAFRRVFMGSGAPHGTACGFLLARRTSSFMRGTPSHCPFGLVHMHSANLYVKLSQSGRR